MSDFGNLSKHTLAEVIHHLIEENEFKSLKNIGLEEEAVKTALLDLAAYLKKSEYSQSPRQSINYDNYNLSPQVLTALSKLNSKEEYNLFKSFKLV